jgi:hypothetical protein
MLEILENHKPRVYFSNPGFTHEPFIFKGFGWCRYIYIFIYLFVITSCIMLYHIIFNLGLDPFPN